ncbi:MAG: type I restriction-modification system subunit M [Deferribacteraceae bacterium]|jgi:type I restriction enzyme M protein|nr:type I restriction-modification system subunit M [Deferribacteraceae bacterium]
MNKQQLASKIWQSANKMRSKIEANEYKDYILGFIFYKFLSDKELKLLRAEGMTTEGIKSLTESDTESVSFIKNKIGYFMAYNDLFSTWLLKSSDFNVSDVRDALSAFNRHINSAHKKVFTGIFNTLQTGLSKLGDTAASQTKAISDLLGLIKDIPMDGKQDYDVLGFVYEYLISNFAANAGKKAGEFYTPHEVSLLMSEIVAEHLKNYKKIKIYDPTSGSGSLLINIGQSAAKHIDDENNIRYYAQELKVNTFNLTRMNLIMRGILPDNIAIRNGDTLEDDWPYFDEDDPHGAYEPLYVDAVVSNPPYSQAWEPAYKDADPRYSGFGLAPKTKADFAFLLHDLYHLKPDGIMTIVLPHGVLFRGDAEGADGEGKIRKNLFEQGHIDAIIGLPPNVFFGTGIATIIMVLRQRQKNDDVLFIDASKGFVKVGKNNQLRASDIKKIADTVASRADIHKFSRKVNRDEIRKNGYNLNIPRYVDSSDAPVSWDLYATMFGGIPKPELTELDAYWSAFPKLWTSLFKDEGTPFVSLATDDVKQAILNNADIEAYIKRYTNVFDSFELYLNNELIGKALTLNISRQETIICEDIFSRLLSVPLIDRYKAYQALNNEWVKIAIDLEIIQTEGFEAVKVVDPNMIVKKKGDTESEAQEGWIGRVIPFELVQATLLRDVSDALRQKENRITEIAAGLEEIIESLSEEEKEEYKDAFNEKDGTLSKNGILNYLKSVQDGVEFPDESVENKLIIARDLFAEESKLKKEVKTEGALLNKLTKETIENLTDEQALMLLDLKWVKPIVAAMNELPHDVIRELVTKLTALAEKYAVTYTDVTDKINKAKNEVVTLVDKLRGSEFDMKGLSEFQSLLRGEKLVE